MATATIYNVRITDRLLRFDTTNGDIVAQLLPFAQTPNAIYEIHKISVGDGNTVTIQVDSSTSDFLLPDGSTSITLSDDSLDTVYIKIPADGLSPAYVNSGGAGGGGGITGTSPPVSNLQQSVIVRSNSMDEVLITYDIDPSATPANFSGVAIYLEDPDISSQPTTALDGSSTLNRTSQVAGNWSPQFENNNYSAWTSGVESHLPADFLVAQPHAGASYNRSRSIRVYLASFGPNTNPRLVRANQPNATPSIVIPMPIPSAAYERGEEYAWLITNPAVALEEDFDRPDPQYRMLYTYEPPDPNLPVPPGMSPFGGVEIKFAKPDSANTDPVATITDTGVFVPVGNADGYLSPVYNPVSDNGTFRVYFCSGDNSQPSQVNTLIPGVTPYVEVTIVYPPSTNAAGQPVTPDITQFTLANARLVWQPDGSIWAEADLTWTNPTQVNYSGVMFYQTAVDGNQVNPPVLLGQAGNAASAITLEVQNYPHDAAHTWTITAISFDANGKMNNNPEAPRSGSPQVQWTIGPPGPGGTGEEFAGLVDISKMAAPVTEQQVSNDGLQMMRFTFAGWAPPAQTQGATKFAGMKIELVDNNNTLSNPVIWDAGMSTTFTTPWMPAVSEQDLTFYYVSYSAQNQVNSILPGSTPSQTVHFVPSPGEIKASQIPNNWWDTSIFAWPDWPDPNGFTIDSLIAGKVAVGSVLRVGGAPASSPFSPSFAGQNGQIAVYSSGQDPLDINGTPTLRAWMGQQASQKLPDGTTATVYGGWFGELYVGGSGPPTSPIYVKNGGIVIVGGWDVQTVNNQSYYPYISIRDRTNTEVGRMGAHLAANPGTGVPPTVPPGDIADIGGAWFKEFATGGVNLSDWRLLCPGDNSIRIRNINRFEIDYPVNVAPAPPYNQPYQMLLGTDQAYVTTAAGATNYKYPGITLMRSGTTHGISIINRGIILGSDQNPSLAALVSFNGDQTGGDGDPFWAVLTMKGPGPGGVQNVVIASGSATNGAAYMTLGDNANNVHFEVRQNGDVQFTGQLLQGASAAPVTDSTGNWIGGIKASFLTLGSLNISGAAANPVIDAAGNFVGPSVNVTGKVTAASNITGSNGFWVSPSVQVIDNTGKWVGPAITAAGQTPWTQNISANGWSLGTTGAGVPSGGNMMGPVCIYSKNNQYWLTDGASGTTPTIGIFGGNGFIIAGANDTNPALNIQQTTISMNNSNGVNVMQLQSNYPDGNYPTGVCSLVMNYPDGSQSIAIKPVFGDQTDPINNPSRPTSKFPVIGLGSGSTAGGFVQVWNNRIHGFTTGGSNLWMLHNGANGTAGALYLYNNGSQQLVMDASNLVQGSWPGGSPVGYLQVTIQGVTRKIPYY